MLSVLSHYPEGPFFHEGLKVTLQRVTQPKSRNQFVGCYHFCLQNQESDVVGWLNFRVGNDSDLLDYVGQIGYEVEHSHQGNGYAVKACRAIAEFIASVETPVSIHIPETNLASLRVAEKLGAELKNVIEVPSLYQLPYAPETRTVHCYQWDPVGEVETGANRG